jgi:hypothetical protein
VYTTTIISQHKNTIGRDVHSITWQIETEAANLHEG